MGRIIEKIALERNHNIVACLEKGWSPENLKNADVAIEFTQPDSAFSNIHKALKYGIPVVSGTTGWYDRISDLEEVSKTAGLVYASNFSLGVNILFEINKISAQLLADHEDYNVNIHETHHTEKKDIPSGTAITLAESIIERNKLSGWTLTEEVGKLPIKSYRKIDIPGNHTITYQSGVDEISISHTAFNREGFAVGALIASEKIIGKIGIHKFNSLLF